MSRTNPLALFFWFLFWPISEIFGRPPEAGEPMTWQRALKVIGAAISLGIVLVLVVVVGVKVGLWK
jgi:hypothetical protein